MRLIDIDDFREQIEILTWYHINSKGDLVGGAESREKALYKATDIYMLIDNAPTVEQIDDTELQRAIGYAEGYSKGRNERPQGEWITVHKQNSFGQDCVCFECNKCHKYKMPLYKLMITEPLEVCPNCGADMRGAEK